MSARHANRRESICCDSVGRCRVCIHPCQCEFATVGSLGNRSLDNDSLGSGSFAGGSFGSGLSVSGMISSAAAGAAPSHDRSSFATRFRFAIARPTLAEAGPVVARMSTRGLTNDSAVVRSTRAMSARRARGARDVGATLRARTSRTRIFFLESIHFGATASGRLSTAMIDSRQHGIDRASGCADVSDCAADAKLGDVANPSDVANSAVTADDRRFNRSTLARHSVTGGALTDCCLSGDASWGSALGAMSARRATCGAPRTIELAAALPAELVD